jgi:hypothetical protein
MKKSWKIVLIVLALVLVLLGLYIYLNSVPGKNSDGTMMGTGCDNTA